MALLNTETVILNVPLDKIAPNPYQPRKFFEKDSIEELARSIIEYGIMQPISVRLINGSSYELVAGERRLRASRLAGLTEVPAIIVNIGDKDSAMLAIIENIQRENLNYIEEAIGYCNLLNDYKFTQDELASRLGKSQSTIANKIRLLRLPKKIQKVLIEAGLSERHARSLVRINDENVQEEVLKKVIKFDLNVKNTEELVERTLNTEESNGDKDKKESKVKRIVKDIRLFKNSIVQAIDIMKQSGYDTNYTIDQKEDGYEIIIKVNSDNKQKG